MTRTAWVEFRNAREDGREKIYRSYHNHDCHCMTFYWSPFVRCFIYNKPKVKFMHSSKTQYTTEKNYIISHTQNTTALHRTVFLTEVHVHGLLVANKGASAFPSANNCQGQLQTPQSVSVVTSFFFHMMEAEPAYEMFCVRYKNKKTKTCNMLYRPFVSPLLDWHLNFCSNDTARPRKRSPMHRPSLYVPRYVVIFSQV